MAKRPQISSVFQGEIAAFFALIKTEGAKI